MYGERGLERRGGDERLIIHRRTLARHRVRTHLHGPGRIRHSIGHRFGDSPCAHGDHSGDSHYRHFGKRHDAHLEQQRRKGLRRFGRVERQQKYKWLADYRSDLGKLDLYVDLRRLRPTSSAVRHGIGGTARPDCSLERKPEYGG